MTQEEFKKLWEADEKGSGITFDDISDRAKEWGLFEKPKSKCCDVNIVRYKVLKAAKCVDAEEFNPDIKDCNITQEEKEKLRKILYQLKYITDSEEKNPFVGIYFNDLIDLLVDYKLNRLFL